VYEWIESTTPPADWANLADTAQGLPDNISGTPKYADNTVFTVKQKYDSAANGFVNYYYYLGKKFCILARSG
jgi:hypothetical protein